MQKRSESPPPAKRVRRRRPQYLLLVVVAAYVLFALLRPLPKLQPTAALAKPAGGKTVSLAWPGYGEAAVGAVGYGLLASHGTQTPVPSASTAKMVTALAVLQKHPLKLHEQGPELTMTDQDVAFYNSYLAVDGSVVPVTAGEQISEYQALEALLLPSANNMAETLAIWAFGSITAYTDYANQYVQQLGLGDTHLADASGFSPATVTTADDLVRLGVVAMQNPVIAEIVDQPSADLPGVTVKNVNGLLGTHDIVGIKTGNTDQAGGVFLSASKATIGHTTLTLVSAIMGSPDLWQSMHDTVPLLDSLRSKFAERTIVPAGGTVGFYLSPDGKSTDIVAGQTLKGVAWQSASHDAVVSLQPVEPGAPKGQAVGTIRAKNDPQQTVPAVLAQSPPAPSVVWRLTHPF